MMKWWMKSTRQDKRNEIKKEQERDNPTLRVALNNGMKFILLPIKNTLRTCPEYDKDQFSKQRNEVLASEVRS